MMSEFDGTVGSFELNEPIKSSIVNEGDDLSDFVFDDDDKFIRRSQEDQDTDPAEWAVVDRRFKYRVYWMPGNDYPPTRENHRVYTLLNFETTDEIVVSERELKTGDWEHIDDTEDTIYDE